ncbi:MAG: interleukin-like EMT inducer domain-containing protein, partial [Chloroflexota bacterium]
HYNFVTSQWFPFYTLFLLKTLRQDGRKNIWLAALFAAFCLYAELTFSVFLLFITLILLTGEGLSQVLGGPRGNGGIPPASPLGLPKFLKFGTHPIGAWVNKPRRVANGKSFTNYNAPFTTRRGHSPRFAAIRLFFIALLTFLLTAPFVLAVLPDFLDPATHEPGWGEGLKLSADLAGLFTLTPLHPLAGVDWVSELRAVIEGTARFSDANTLFLGYGILALALLGFAVRRRGGRVWLWSVVIFAVLSLGPLLTFNGRNRFDLDGLEVTFPLPFALLHYLPLINANRVPNRFGIPLTMALAVLVGYAVAWLNQRVTEAASRNFTPHPSLLTLHASRFLPLIILNMALLAFLLFDQYSVPLPLTDARIPPVYDQIGAEPDDFTLLQLPLGWRNSYGTLGAERTQVQYYQAAHQRPMLGGNTSRNPAFKFDYYRQIPLFYALTETELYRPVDETTWQRARQQAAELMTLYNIKYLVIHQPIPYRRPYEDTYLATRKLALDLIPHRVEPVYRSPGVEAFAVEPAPIPEPLALDFGDWRSDPYRGEGWAGNETIFAATANWAAAPQTIIFFPARHAGERRLALQIAPFSYPGMPPQTVGLSLNGQTLPDNFTLGEGWQVIEVTLPAAYVQTGLNRLALHFGHTAQPRRVLPANRAIGDTGLDTPVDLELHSGPDFAFMSVGFGEEAVDASAHRRGVNVAVVEAETGRLLERRGFDSAANQFEAAALVEFLAGTPAGQLVLVATQGADAAAFFTSDTRAALQTIGLPTELPAPPFAAIGVKGAPPGAALLAAGEGGAYLRLGASPDTRSLAAAVDKVIISK